MWVVEPTRDECKRIAESELGEACVASPAFQDGRIYIRGRGTRSSASHRHDTSNCSPNAVDLAPVDRIVADSGRAADAVIPILQAIQAEYRYLAQRGVGSGSAS